jgi:ubiquinone/menaquinone biosynthesis C-methylase UbiE
MRFVLKIFYRLLYHRMAWTYDLVAWGVSVGLWREWIGTVLEFLEGPRVLELGHGPGHLQRELLHRGAFRSVGLDLSRQMGEMAIRRLRRQNLQPALVNGEAQSLPFLDASFDQVVATFPSEYIADPHTLAEVRRVLADQGTLVILPAAYITGKRVRERAAAFLFRITGQAPQVDEQALKSFAAQGGFDVHLERRTLQTSIVLVIIARKVSAG